MNPVSSKNLPIITGIKYGSQKYQTHVATWNKGNPLSIEQIYSVINQQIETNFQSEFSSVPNRTPNR